MSEETKVTVEEAVTPEVDVEPEAVEEAITGTAPEAEPTPEAVPTPEEVNAANAERSTGKVVDDGMGAAFFTAADVRAMSREQVRRNLPKILKSMESDKF